MIWILLSAFIVWNLVFIMLDKNILEEKEHDHVFQLNQQSLAVIIVMRNESKNIVECLSSIDSQNWLPKNTEVIVVDDHSDDDSLGIVECYSPINVKIRTNKLSQKSGKKEGLKLALSMVNAEIVYFTDADCELMPEVVLRLIGKLVVGGFKAVFGPVMLKSNNVLGQLLIAENLNNQCVTEAFVRYSHPIMSNGANMMISRDAIGLYRKTLESEIMSGDDVFFAQIIGKQSTCVMSKSSIVWTNAPINFVEFINQRLRWASKTTDYPSMLAKLFGVVVFMVSIIFALSLLIIPFVNGAFWILLLFGLKILIEYGYHGKWSYKYGVRHKLPIGIALSVIYPFYVVLVGVFSMLGVGFIWKGRYAKR